MVLAGCAEPPLVGDLAIRDVTVIDVENTRRVANQTVLVTDGTITGVVPASSPLDVEVLVDGKGAFLVPGLWDMHAHLRGNGLPGWVTTDWLMPLTLAHGVTGVRDMNSDCASPDQGPVCLKQMQDFGERVEQGTLDGPRLIALSSFQVTIGPGEDATEASVRELVRELAGSGVDVIKTYSMPQEVFGWLLDEARREGVATGGHIPLSVSVEQAAAGGLGSLEHARDLVFDCFPGASRFRETATSNNPPIATMEDMVSAHDEAICRRAFAAMVEDGVAYTPTHLTRRMEAFAHDSAFRADPRGRYIPPPVLQSWMRDADQVLARSGGAAGRRAYMGMYEKGLEITGAAFRAGVTILVGTDAPDSFAFPGSGLHDELGELVKAGLTPAEALRAATLDAAAFLGLHDRFGTVEAGKAADMVLLARDPLSSIDAVSGIEAVFLGGRYFDRAALDALLESAEEVANRPPAGG